MDLLVPLCYLAFLIDLDNCVLDLERVHSWLVYPDVNRKLLAAGLFPQAKDKLALVDGLGKPDSFITRARNVVARFGEKQSLRRTRASVS